MISSAMFSFSESDSVVVVEEERLERRLDRFRPANPLEPVTRTLLAFPERFVNTL